MNEPGARHPTSTGPHTTLIWAWAGSRWDWEGLALGMGGGLGEPRVGWVFVGRRGGLPKFDSQCMCTLAVLGK